MKCCGTHPCPKIPEDKSENSPELRKSTCTKIIGLRDTLNSRDQFIFTRLESFDLEMSHLIPLLLSDVVCRDVQEI